MNIKENKLKRFQNFNNRELSLLEFNYRVLMEAKNKNHPLLERLKFISIVSSNLDEFFMIRVAGLKSQISAGHDDLSYDGKTPKQQLKEIRKKLESIYKLQEEIFNTSIINELEENDIFIHHFDKLLDSDIDNLEEYFLLNVLPLLTPMVLDSTHPFPRLIERSLNIAFVLNSEEEEQKIAFVDIPGQLDRIIRIERSKGHHFILIESLIKYYARYLFPGLEIITSNTFRITRDADIEIAEDEADDLISEIEELLNSRKWKKDPVRLEVSYNMPIYLVELLKESLELENNDIYFLDRPLKLSDFIQILELDIQNLKDSPLVTKIPAEFKSDDISVFDTIKKQDILVHHPYESFTNSTIKYINRAADDKNVIAIKITLYRVGSNSIIVEALKRAAIKGKEVTAFVELKARFDEENNLIWARELEDSGAKVIYGVVGLKTHAKVLMVVRKENNELQTYLHFSTGNYNHINSRIYTDIGFFTTNKDFIFDVINLFNFLTGHSKFEKWKKIIVAPAHLQKKIISLIKNEIECSTKDNPGEIFLKMNSLAHREVIKQLYKASEKGVKIRLLIRGICCLKPGIEGLSKNIIVKSNIGRFLEHSRIFYFKNSDCNYYISSADWMTRNFHRRIETMIPIEENKLQIKLRKILDMYWKDNSTAWTLCSDGSYEKLELEKNEKRFNAQQYFVRHAEKTSVESK